ncbi:hypothetical protein EXIGLDRAFT_725405 [Exidia glandulosa HHB12029]|uniref:SAM domain-containing protein n=1 Tax=Exidia glandulosa HHB12029 TaxID=1314781 RepID=A0A165E2W8_EXIGL|nr:hypothetical protein EXIGLDRAFT_725405 [Exidia glandulosa HHB12029]
MRHILALEVLLSLLLFNMVLMAGYFALRHLRRPRAKRPSPLPLHSSTSSMTGIKPLPRSPNPSTHLLQSWPASPKPSVARPSSPTPRPITPMRDTHRGSALRRAATPEEDHMASVEASPSGSTLLLRQLPSTVPGLLDEELAPPTSRSRSDRNHLVLPAGSAPAGKKSARRMSIPRSALGSSTDAMSEAVGSGSGYPAVSDFLSRLQTTYPQQEVAQYKAAFSAEGIFVLDELRGVTAPDLRTKIKNMTTSHAEFIVRAIKHELDWIDADRQRGGMGFRMVLSS